MLRLGRGIVGMLPGALLLFDVPAVAQIDLPVSTPAPQMITTAPVEAASTGAGIGSPDVTGNYLLHTMFATLAQQKSWSADVVVTSTLTVSGMERTNLSRSLIWMKRPHHVVWKTLGDSGISEMCMDGKECILHLPSLKRYTVTPYGGTPDDHLLAMSSLLGPVASALLAAEPSIETLQAMLSGPVELLGIEQFPGMAYYRLRLPIGTGATELWVATGAHPLPVKLVAQQVLTSAGSADASALDGSRVQMDFRWSLNQKLPEDAFKLRLPEASQRVDVLGGPNTTVTKGKAAPKNRKSTSAKRAAEPKKPNLGLAFDPPPIVGARAGVAAAWNSGDVPSLSQGLAPLERQPSGPGQSPVVNPAPDVVLPLMDGGSVRLSSLRGRKAVVLDFWASWCGPCHQAMPAVADAARMWKGRGVDFYAVNMAEDLNQVRSFSKQQRISIPVALDSDGKLASAFGVDGIPHLVVIGRDGGIRGIHTGSDANLRQKLDRELEAAL